MKHYILISLLTLSLSIAISTFTFANTLTLESAINTALQENPEVAAALAKADADHALIRSQYWLDNPRLGLMREQNLNLMETQMGPMNLWSIAQEVKFPTKYFLLGTIQKLRAQSADYQTSAKKLEIRTKVISTYYNLFSTQKIILLLEAQKQTLIEVARSAEVRRATGAVPQQDEMKAHVEQTKLETEILTLQEEHETNEATLLSLLNQNTLENLSLPENDLPIPSLSRAEKEIQRNNITQSKQVLSVLALSEEAEMKRNLAKWNFAPDFSFIFKKAWTTAPSDNYALGVELSIPLWFFMKQTSEYAAASARATEADKNLEKIKRDVSSEFRALSAKVKAHSQLLQIYETSLIPQATSMLNSSRAAYQAGKTTFLELLDSERSLYAVRISFYRTLSQYVEYLSKLEEIAGVSLSTLPNGGLQ